MFAAGLVDMISTDYAGGHHDPILLAIDRATRAGVVSLPAAVAMATANVADAIAGQLEKADVRSWFLLPRTVQFAILTVPEGRHTIQVRYLGYEPRVVPNVLVRAGQETVLEIALTEQIVEGAEVVVEADARDGRPLDDMAAVSARSFSVEEARRYAGAVDDPARLAAAFAGVATSGSGVQDNALAIRGNAPKGVLWRLEGVPIPTPAHFAGQTVAGGGGLTLFSGQLLTDSDFLSGAFPADYGNALAGVFDMNFRTGNPTQREHTLQASVLGLEAASEGPFVQGRPSTYLFNYRYSTLALLMPLDIQAVKRQVAEGVPKAAVARKFGISRIMLRKLALATWVVIWAMPPPLTRAR